MRILVVATKSPWPPRDGGRLALWLTLEGLAEAGHEVMLIAPDEGVAVPLPATAKNIALRLVSAKKPPLARIAWSAVRHASSLGVARHRCADVEKAVDAAIDEFRPDIVHVEQLQAWANAAPALRAGLPVVLRMQNVESELWSPRAAPPLLGPIYREEAGRLRRDEAHAIGAATCTLALTQRDAERLPGRVVPLTPPFPSRLPAGAPVSGIPAIALAGSTGWRPNRDGAKWFLDEVAPLLQAMNGEARVHVFGGEASTHSNVIVHRAPDDAQDAFPDGAVAAIPLHLASGIRMRILEAWARGLPVVATPVAAAGLDVADGREVLIAASPAEFANALHRLAQDAALRDMLVRNGRCYLERNHSSVVLTAALVEQYRLAIALVGR